MVANAGGMRVLKIVEEIENSARHSNFDARNFNAGCLEIEMEHLKRVIAETDWETPSR